MSSATPSLASGCYIIALLLLPTLVIASRLDGDALTKFIRSADPAGTSKLAAQWVNGDPCTNSWPGVKCSDNGFVMSVVLDDMQLTGRIPPDSLGQLGDLRVLSLNRNGLTGQIPSDLGNCTQLKQLFLSSNMLTGPIPNSLSHRLRRLYLSNNMLSGSIPLYLADISGLLSLHLENNRLTGPLPAFNQTDLNDFNVSNNLLMGQIPQAFASKDFPDSAFRGNVQLCGAPLASCMNSSGVSNGAAPAASKKKLTTGQITAIVVVDFAFLLFLTIGSLLYYKKRHARSHGQEQMKSDKKYRDDSGTFPESGGELDFQSSTISMANEDKPKLVFFEDKHTFRLEDLLRASAELLGKGSLGSAYKALMEDGRAVCVKRLKELNGIAKKEFEQQMQLVGKLRHPNVVPLWAYYYAKEEKLLVYEYLPNGNLLNLLHGGQRRATAGGAALKPLSWNARLRIARGVANGLAFLHHECESQKMPHGNLKASNILIDKNFEACIADFGVAPLLTPSTAAVRMVGYRAPEYESTKKISPKADVYSFGILLLEMLTGRLTDYNDVVHGGSPQAFDLAQWVHSVVREEWTAEVFDRTLIVTNASEEALVTTLQIAMACINKAPDQRPRMSQVYKMITEIKEDEYNYTSPSMSIEQGRFGMHDQFTSSDDSAIMKATSPFYEDDKSFGF